ncbi:FecR family protein [Algoriphagus aquimarinus]|uniref:FecR family protein n=1 Tax=Algoriphagus aquimarinus TaxID=237018 RepID=UPI0030D73F83
MKKSNKLYIEYTIQDFLTDETFINWVKGRATHVDWDVILDNNPNLLTHANEAKKQIELLSFETSPIDEKRISILHQRILENIEVGEKVNVIPISIASKRKRPSKPNFLWVAAISIAILSLLGLGVWNAVLKNSTTIDYGEYITKETAKGQRLTAILSDGSKVVLNSGGKLSYQQFFSDTARIVLLEGEAFFEVAEDKNRPFRVITGKTVTTALGTSFNINQGNEDVRISLVSGKVEVGITDNAGAKESLSLLPGEQVVADVQGPISFIKENFDPEEVTAWQRDVLFFKNASSAAVFQKIELWYGVDIHSDKDYHTKEDWHYTGSFEGEKLEDVLSSIGFVKGFSYTIKKNNQVHLQPN